MSELLTTEALSTFLQVTMIDLVLAEDTALVIGLTAAGLPSATRRFSSASSPPRSLRIVFAGITTQLLQTVGLLLAGGILLLRVCWKMWRELRAGHAEKDLEAEEALDDRDLDEDGLIEDHAPKKPLARRPGRSLWPTSPCRSTMFWLAGAAQEHPVVLYPVREVVTRAGLSRAV